MVEAGSFIVNELYIIVSCFLFPFFFFPDSMFFVFFFCRLAFHHDYQVIQAENKQFTFITALHLTGYCNCKNEKQVFQHNITNYAKGKPM